MSKDKDETIKKDYKDTDMLKIQMLSENAHSSFTIAFSIVVGIVIGLVSSYLSYYLTNQTYATYLSYLVSIFFALIILVIALPYISYLYKGQIKIISNYIKKIEDGKKLPSLEEMLSKKK